MWRGSSGPAFSASPEVRSGDPACVVPALPLPQGMLGVLHTLRLPNTGCSDSTATLLNCGCVLELPEEGGSCSWSLIALKSAGMWKPLTGVAPPLLPPPRTPVEPPACPVLPLLRVWAWCR
jgi:hypothetical protein